MAQNPRHHTDYTVGWICALPIEVAASKAILETTHQPLPQSANDHNVYTLGELYGHNIVIACLPLGIYGICPATIVATHMLHTFPALRFTLLVGIGGGVPTSTTSDIRLGDVVVSKPTSTFGGVVQYDYGKAISENRFQRIGALNKPPSILLAAISRLEADSMIGDTSIPVYLGSVMARFNARARLPHFGPDYDVLYESGYQHVGGPGESCHNCSKEYIVPRPHRPSKNPRIHYGLIASGNLVIKDGSMRDRIKRDLGGDILCFEMEAAGLMNDFKCLVIRGICDYADSHKNKIWQPYAAAAATAYAKKLLSVISPVDIRANPKADSGPQSTMLDELSLEDILKLPRFETTPSHRDVLQLGASRLIRQAQLVALRGPWYASSVCSSCELLEIDFQFKDFLWICCQCGHGPSSLSISDHCTQCGHALCAL